MIVVATALLVSVCLAATSAAHKPTIRIAHLYDVDDPFMPLTFMQQLMKNNTDFLLPDFEVVIDDFGFVRDVGDSSAKLVDALLHNPPYHAVLGPSPKVDCRETATLTSVAKILQVGRCDNVEFTSQRDKYPYIFRVGRSEQGTLQSFMYITASNGWHSSLGVWKESATLETAVDLAVSYNITHYTIVAQSGDQWLMHAWQETAVGLIQLQRLRVVMSYIAEVEAYGLMCRLYRSRISGIQSFVDGGFVPGWIFNSFPLEAGDCSVDEMYYATRGIIGILHTPGAPGTNLFGVLQAPAIGGDQSQLPLTCTPTFTPDKFVNDGTLLTHGIMTGDIYDVGSATKYLAVTAVTWDMLCVSLLALHDVLYSKGVALEDLESRNEQAFHQLIDATSKVEMVGPTGRFRFYNKTGDPIIQYYTVSQYHVPGLDNYSATLTAVIAFPDGRPELHDVDGPLVWLDGSTGLGPKPHLALFPACGLENAELIWGTCRPCAAGRFYDPLLDSCRTCQEGYYQNNSGSSSCITAEPGDYIADVLNPREPTPCLIGHECRSSALTRSEPCSPGTYTNASGAAACRLCPTGSYASGYGSTACEVCDRAPPGIRGSTTAEIASTSAAECICPVGTFMQAELPQTKCVRCPDGLSCPEASNWSYWQRSSNGWNAVGRIPEVQRGYMTIASKPVLVYKCREAEDCPGGLPGTCAAYRDPTKVACGSCVDGAYESSDGCELCGQADSIPMLLAACASVFCIGLATFAVNRDVESTSLSALMLLAVFGLLFSSLQALGVFSQMAVPWNEPVKSMLKLMEFLSFDLRVLRSECVTGSDPVRSFALRQSLPLVAIPFICFWLLVKKFTPIGKSKIHFIVELSNAIGTLFSIFFISIMISALNPFICYKHPGGNGMSVQSAPSLLCFEGGAHSAMLIFGLLAILLIPLPFLALCGYGILVYKRSITSPDSSEFLHAMRFLFFRYTPKMYYFHLVLLGKGLLLCLIPAVFRGQAATQVLFTGIVVALYVLVEEETRPWRAYLCNPLDSIMNLALLVMLLCGALFVEENPEVEVVNNIATITASAFCLLCAWGIGCCIWRLCGARPRYNFFMCHHKAHAGAQARFIKILLVRAGVTVFIDADDLKELDELFEIVRLKVKHCVVYLTSDTLRRPWCVGELVTSIRARLAITRLVTPSFVPLLDEQVHDPQAYIHSAECNLAEYGIQWKDVSDALQQFFGGGVPELCLSSEAIGTRRFDLATCRLLRRQMANAVAPSLTEVHPGGVIVATHGDSDEANAAGGILVSSIAEGVYRASDGGLCLLADYQPDALVTRLMVRNAVAVVVILSNGSLQSEIFLSVICELVMAQENVMEKAPAMVSVSTPDFEFPSSTTFKKLSGTCPDLEIQYPAGVESLVRVFFKQISIYLPCHASQEAIDTQANQVFARITEGLRGLRSSVMTGGSNCGSAMSLSKLRSNRSVSSSKRRRLTSGPSSDLASDDDNLVNNSAEQNWSSEPSKETLASDEGSPSRLTPSNLDAARTKFIVTRSTSTEDVLDQRTIEVDLADDDFAFAHL